jgi:putative thioredoxin
LERLAEEHGGKFILAKVNVDENPELAALFQIQGIPAVKLFRGGQIAAEFAGALPEAAVRELLSRFLPSELDERAAEAARLEEGGRSSEAEAVYREILSEKPQHAKALLGLGRVLVASGQDREALECLDRVSLAASERQEADRLIARLKIKQGGDRNEAQLRSILATAPDNIEARFNLAQTLAAQERYEEALGEYLAVVKKDRSFRDDGARKAMLEIFGAIGSDSDLTQGYRSELAKVLFS